MEKIDKKSMFKTYDIWPGIARESFEKKFEKLAKVCVHPALAPAPNIYRRGGQNRAKVTNLLCLNWSYQSHSPDNDRNRPVFASDYRIMFNNVITEHFLYVR